MNEIRIATRESPLALWQAEEVARQLNALHPDLTVTLVKMTTQGDVLLDKNLSAFGGKGLFVKELERSLLEGSADIAVHSMKDVPIAFPSGLQLSTIMQREDPADAFVSNRYSDIKDLPAGAIVGTSSLRRQAQLRAHYPHLDIRDLRGNVGTRLRKLDNEQYNAIILAVAGLKRLQLVSRIQQSLPFDISLPAIGQGAIGIECRVNDPAVASLIAPLNHRPTQVCVEAERALNAKLAGGCHAPVAGFAEWLDDTDIQLRGLVGEPDGSRLLSDSVRGSATQAQQLGIQLAERLLAQGAGDILQKLVATA